MFLFSSFFLWLKYYKVWCVCVQFEHFSVHIRFLFHFFVHIISAVFFFCFCTYEILLEILYCTIHDYIPHLTYQFALFTATLINKTKIFFFKILKRNFLFTQTHVRTTNLSERWFTTFPNDWKRKEKNERRRDTKWVSVSEKASWRDIIRRFPI